MRRVFSLFCVLLAACTLPRYEEHLRTFCDPAQGGRLTGTPGAEAAAEYLERQFQKIGLKAHRQEFDFREDDRKGVSRNILVVVPGQTDEHVIVGAHYDAVKGSPGADDNASGAAMLLELAREFNATPCRRTILFIAFSGEEIGLLGSHAYLAYPRIPLSKTVAMINLDMVGRLATGKLIAMGSASGDTFERTLQEANTDALDIHFANNDLGRSDHVAFYMKDIPSVHFFTGAHPEYHSPGDTIDRLDYAGMNRIQRLVSRFLRRLANDSDRPRFVKAATLHDETGVGRGKTPSLGTMPDYSFEGPGVRLEGVMPGSPAERGGLKEGDILLEYDHAPLANVEDYARKLFRESKPGDHVLLKVARGDQILQMDVTLAARARKE